MAITYAYHGLSILDHLGDSMSAGDLDNRLLLYRTLMVSLALQQTKGGYQDLSEFKTITKSAMKLIDNQAYTHGEVAIAVLEGMSTGQGILKMDATFATLEKAWDLYKSTQQLNPNKHR